MLSPVELLRERAAAHPDQPALAVGDEILHYGRWQFSTEVVAARFAEAGMRAGDVVLLRFSLESFLSYAVAYTATLRLAAVAVPAAVELRDDEFAAIREACGAAWIVSAVSDGQDGIGLEPVRQSVPQGGPPQERLSDAHPEPTDVAEIIFTSGTTGDPQGVLCPYGEIGFDYDLTSLEGGGARGVDAHAAAFGTNFCQEMLRGPLKWGSFVVTLPRFGSDAVTRAMRCHDVTTLRLAPVMAQALVRAFGPGDLDKLREISVSSAFCPPEVLDGLQRLAPGAAVVNQYSLTESGRAKMKNVWGEGPREALGRPVEGTEVQVVGPDGPVPVGASGEIQIRHVEAIARQYLRGDRAVAAVSGGADWISTGDVGYLDDRGYVVLMDRARDLINVGGRKVSPLAVERLIAAQPGVAEAAVCGIPHPTLGEVPAVLIVPEGSGERPDLDLDAVLQSHESPKVVVTAIELPRNRSGKILRDEVRALILSGQQASGTQDGDDLTEAFKVLCSRVLEREVTDLDVSWYAAGGDSMSALELFATIEDDYGVEFDVALLSPEFRLRDLLARVREGGSAR